MTDPSDLERLIADEIGATGPITFARFMELALYHPTHGYYRQAAPRPTREGDFLTAPEMHPIFGWTLAREVDRLWRAIDCPRPFRLVEYGAGSGVLALAVLEGLRRAGSGLADAIEYEPVELNERRLAELRTRLAEAGLARRLVRDVGERGPDEAPAVGLVLANEFLDALPVHRVEADRGALRELFVDGRGEGFAEMPGAPSTPALEARLAEEGVRLADGQQAEVSLGLDAWLDDVARRLGRGFVLAIDYGFEAAELYSSRRPGGTMLAYAGHAATADYLAEPGRRDLTAHVDFTAVRSVAVARGFVDLGFATQRDVLVAAGLGDELIAVQRDPATTFSDYALVRSAVRRLLDPRATGDFRVMLLGRGVDSSICLAGSA